MENFNDFLNKSSQNIEKVDIAIYDWLDKELNLHYNSKDGFKKVPVLWVTPERSFSSKYSKEIKDENGSLNLPIITIERTAIIKDEKLNTSFYSSLPETLDRVFVGQRINQKKTSEFANTDYDRLSSGPTFISPKRNNDKIVYKFYYKKTPVYANFTYLITFTSQFQQHMNEMVQPLLTKTGRNRYFVLKNESCVYECFLDPNFSIKNNVNNMDLEERRFTTSLDIKVLANLVSMEENEDDAIIKEYENAVDIKFSKDLFNIEKIKNIEPAKRKLIKQLDIYKPPSSPNAGILIDASMFSKKVFLIGNNVDTSYIINHNFNSRDILVIVRTNGGEDGNTFETVEVGIDYTDLNTVILDFGDDPVPNGYYNVTVMG